jgi:hypothetical protein
MDTREVNIMIIDSKTAKLGVALAKSYFSDVSYIVKHEPILFIMNTTLKS